MSTAASTATLSPAQRPPITVSDASATGQNSEHQPFNIHSCSAGELMNALVGVRGKEEASRILKEASEILSRQADENDAALVSPDDKRSTSPKDEMTSSNNVSEEDLGKALLKAPIETSFTTPRMGKFSLQIYERGMVATKTNDPSVRVTLLHGDASHVLVFPKPEDCKAIVYNRKLDDDSKPKKVGASLVLIHLESPLEISKQKSPTQHICFGLPFDNKKKGPIGPSLSDEESSSGTADDPTEGWARLLHQAVGGRLAQVLKTASSGDNAFQSYQAPNTSTTTAGMPFVGCYLGVSDGVLYPLEEGLLFFKPPRFLPRTSLHSIACGRGGDSSSRYVDMVLQCNNSNPKDKESNQDDEESMETVEFTNIQREETGVLNAYILDVLIPAMKKDAKSRTKTQKKDGNEGSDEENEDDDELLAEAVSEDDEATEDDATVVVEGDEDDGDDSDDDDEDYDGGDDNEDENSHGASEGGSDGDSDEDDDIAYGDHDEGIAVVPDEFAQELVKEKRRKQDESSATESEDDDNSTSGGPRVSKRLRRMGA